MSLALYERELARIVAQKYGNLPADRLVEELCRAGVVDPTRCRILAVRRWVAETVEGGRGKVEAMWLATRHFHVSFDYVRHCMYHHTDVNI